MLKPADRARPQGARPLLTCAVCAVCNKPFSSTDAAVFLGAERILMHRACCNAHPSCHCQPAQEAITFHLYGPLNDHGAT